MTLRLFSETALAGAVEPATDFSSVMLPFLAAIELLIPGEDINEHSFESSHPRLFSVEIILVAYCDLEMTFLYCTIGQNTALWRKKDLNCDNCSIEKNVAEVMCLGCDDVKSYDWNDSVLLPKLSICDMDPLSNFSTSALPRSQKLDLGPISWISSRVITNPCHTNSRADIRYQHWFRCSYLTPVPKPGKFLESRNLIIFFGSNSK